MSRGEIKIAILSNWANIVKIFGGIGVACVLFYLNATYVTKSDFTPVAQEIKVQAQQSRRLSKIVDDEGDPVNTDKMVEIQKDIAKILMRMENLNEKVDRLDKNK